MNNFQLVTTSYLSPAIWKSRGWYFYDGLQATIVSVSSICYLSDQFPLKLLIANTSLFYSPVLSFKGTQHFLLVFFCSVYITSWQMLCVNVDWFVACERDWRLLILNAFCIVLRMETSTLSRGRAAMVMSKRGCLKQLWGNAEWYLVFKNEATKSTEACIKQCNLLYN